MKHAPAATSVFICATGRLNPARSTLIFIHGAGESCLLWQAQVEGLSDRATPLRLTFPPRPQRRQCLPSG